MAVTTPNKRLTRSPATQAPITRLRRKSQAPHLQKMHAAKCTSSGETKKEEDKTRVQRRHRRQLPDSKSRKVKNGTWGILAMTSTTPQVMVLMWRFSRPLPPHLPSRLGGGMAPAVSIL